METSYRSQQLCTIFTAWYPSQCPIAGSELTPSRGDYARPSRQTIIRVSSARVNLKKIDIIHVSSLLLDSNSSLTLALVHCLESIRHSIMCRADLTPLQFFWTNDTFHALKVKGVGAQTCLKWDSFEAVRESRTYDRAELQKFHDHGY